MNTESEPTPSTEKSIKTIAPSTDQPSEVSTLPEEVNKVNTDADPVLSTVSTGEESEINSNECIDVTTLPDEAIEVNTNAEPIHAAEKTSETSIPTTINTTEVSNLPEKVNEVSTEADPTLSTEEESETVAPSTNKSTDVPSLTDDVDKITAESESMIPAGETLETKVTNVLEEAKKVDTESEPILSAQESSEPVAPSAEELTEVARNEKEAKLKEHFSAGKRSFLTNEFVKAVDSFSLASSIAAEIYGDEAEESFEPFFNYGRALLELAKIEDQLFSNPTSGMSDIKEEEEDSVPDNDAEDAEDAKDNEAEEAAEEGESDGEEEEDESSLAISWEMLEVAKRICDKKLEEIGENPSDDHTKWSLLKADVLNVLGEHGIADNKFEQAIADLNACDAIQRKFMCETSRVLAQTHYNLGKAYGQAENFVEASSAFNRTRVMLELRVQSLENELKECKNNNLEQPQSIKEELMELVELLDELEAVINDANASAEQAEKIKKYVKSELETAANAIKELFQSKEGAPEVEANDITNMVRRPTKRPSSAVEQVEESITKKTKEGETSEENKA